MTTRAATAEQTRAWILNAARDQFMTAPYDEVTLAGIAAEAGVTTQTILNRFGNKEGLFAALTELIHGEIDSMRRPVPPADVHAVVTTLVHQYEAMGDWGIRLLALEDRNPAVADFLTSARSIHRRWLEEVLAPQLPTELEAREQTVTSLYAATDLYLWKLLRRDLDQSLTETTHVLERLVLGALARESSAGRTP